MYRDTALLRPPYIGIPSYSNRLVSGYRLAQTAVYRDAALCRPPCIGIPPYLDGRVSGYRLTQTALYRHTALLKPPCIGIPPYRGLPRYWGRVPLLYFQVVRPPKRGFRSSKEGYYVGFFISRAHVILVKKSHTTPTICCFLGPARFLALIITMVGIPRPQNWIANGK